MDRVFILLGTNVGNLKENLKKALEELRVNRIKVVKKSKIYKTRPWGNTNQPHFLNMAIEARCNHSPAELLRCLKKIEAKMGRKNGTRWSPRIIDLDIVFYGGSIVKMKKLTIPHKALYRRPFALIPLAEISADFIPPGRKKPLKEYARKINHEGIEVHRN